MRVKLINFALPIVILILLIIIPFCTSGYITSIVMNILMFAGLGVAWYIFSGNTGYINLGVVAFFGLGTYVAVELWQKVPLPALIVIGGAVALIFALLISLPVLRIRGPYFVVLMLGLGELVKSLVERYESQVRGALGTMLLNTPSTEVLYFILLAIFVAAVVTAYVIRNSKLGLGLLSIKGNEEAAEAMGLNTTKYKVIAFTISALFMGFIGTVMALRWTFIEPSLAFNPIITFQVTIMAVLGGMDDLRGPILGAVILTLISEILGIQFVYYYLIILGVILILIIRFLPGGIVGAIKKLHISKQVIRRLG